MFALPGLALLLTAVVGPPDDPPARGRVEQARSQVAKRPATATVTPPESRTAYLAQSATADVKNELAQTEAMHRAAVRVPVGEWRLDEVKARYEALLKTAGDSATAGIIRQRLATVARQEGMARDALEFESVLRQSRLRDGNLAQVRQRLARVKPSERPSYDAEGMIQPSSRKIEGEKALALIGPDGFAVAYLRVPPGIDTHALLAKRVGVRGEVHYDEHLRARVIAVNDIEPLEKAR